MEFQLGLQKNFRTNEIEFMLPSTVVSAAVALFFPHQFRDLYSRQLLKRTNQRQESRSSLQKGCSVLFFM